MLVHAKTAEAAAAPAVLVDEGFGAQTPPADFGFPGTDGTGTRPNIAAITAFYAPVPTGALIRP